MTYKPQARRSAVRPSALPIRVDVPAHQAWQGDRLLKIAPKPFAVLTVLVANAGTLVTHQQTVNEIWGVRWRGDIRVVHAHVWVLRHALGETAIRPAYIETVTGVGYRFNADLVADRDETTISAATLAELRAAAEQLGQITPVVERLRALIRSYDQTLARNPAPLLADVYTDIRDQLSAVLNGPSTVSPTYAVERS